MREGEAVQYASSKLPRAQQVGWVLEILSENMFRVWWPDGARIVLAKLLEPAEEKLMSDLPLFGKWTGATVEKESRKFVAEARLGDGTVEYRTDEHETASAAHSALQYMLSQVTSGNRRYPKVGEKPMPLEATETPVVGKKPKAKAKSKGKKKKGKKKSNKPVKPVNLKTLRKW